MSREEHRKAMRKNRYEQNPPTENFCRGILQLQQGQGGVVTFNERFESGS
jgi:hypothetical protein